MGRNGYVKVIEIIIIILIRERRKNDNNNNNLTYNLSFSGVLSNRWNLDILP